MNETYRKVLQIFVMKNYAALVAKLHLCLEIILRVKLGVTGIISIWRWVTNVSLHFLMSTIKHFFDKSLESQPLLHVLLLQEVSRSCSCKDWA